MLPLLFNLQMVREEEGVESPVLSAGCPVLSCQLGVMSLKRLTVYEVT